MYKFDQKGLRIKVNIDNDPQRRPWKKSVGSGENKRQKFSSIH